MECWSQALIDTCHSQYFFTYEVAKRTQSELIGRDKMGLANHLLAGAAAGASGALVTAPMDVVKTRLQTEVSLPRDQRRYKVSTFI